MLHFITNQSSFANPVSNPFSCIEEKIGVKYSQSTCCKLNPATVKIKPTTVIKKASGTNDNFRPAERIEVEGNNIALNFAFNFNATADNL